MFLTTFDKKMYEEALRKEGREEFAEKYAKLSKDLSEISQRQETLTRDHAKRLFKQGVPYEIARKVVTELPEAELNEIYGMK